MEIFFRVVHLLIFPLHCTFSTVCGPKHSCMCREVKRQPTVTLIDCAKKELELREICEYIESSNRTNFWEIEASGISHVMSSLDKSSLKGCESVTALNLSSNDLKEVAEDTFEDLDSLLLLDLSSNQLRSIYNSTGKPFLRNIRALLTLYLNGNYNISNSVIHSYPTFSHLPNLTTLYMDGLYGAALGKHYRDLHSFVCLGLSGGFGTCDITNLRNDTFVNAPRLQKLDLSQCNIVSIDAGTFTQLKQLRWLDLSKNHQLGFRVLRNISYGLQFTKIDFLNYSEVYHDLGPGTFLTKRDICYFRNTTLRVLSLNNNRLQMLQKNAAMLMPKTFQELHVEGNAFNIGIYLSQGACFANATKLFANGQNKMNLPFPSGNLTVYIDPIANVTIPSNDDCPFMSDSYLKNISKDINRCRFQEGNTLNITDIAFPENLKVLQFSDCNIHHTIPPVPFEVKSVEHLDFSKNVLHFWQGPIRFPNLRTLNLSENYCTDINEVFFSCFRSLEILDLSENFLGSVFVRQSSYKIFQTLSNLVELNLAGNRIQWLPPNIFQNLSSLKSLNLSFNSLSNFQVALDKLDNLTDLDISQNEFRTLPATFIKHFEKLSQRKNVKISINLTGNPLRCTCQNKDFIQQMLQHLNYFVFHDNLTFFDSEDKKISLGNCTNLSRTFSKDCRSSDESQIYVVVWVSALVLIWLFVVTCLIYKNRWKIRYFMYMHKKRFYGYRRLPDEEPFEIYKHDAFISYSEDNIGFILKEIIPNLEKTEDGLSLCIHQRDFLPGNAIADNIIGAIQSSRKTVVLLSKSFLKRKWCLYEFHMARMETMYSREGRGCLIVVMLEPLSTKHMPLEMIQWIKNESYIEFTKDEEGYALFWNKLRDSITSSL